MKLPIFNLTNTLIFLIVICLWYFTFTIISPFLHYHFQQVAFITGVDFFRDFVDYPGGIADYCAEFLSQFFSVNILGSVLIILDATIKGLITLSIVRKLIGETKMKLTIFTLVVIFALSSCFNYYYPFYISVRLLSSFIFTWLFLLLYLDSPRHGFIYWFGLAIVLFYIASGPALIVFAISTSIILLILRKQKYLYFQIPIMLIFSATLPYIGFKFIFLTSLENVYKISMIKPPTFLAYIPEIPVYISYSVLPVILLGSFIYTILPVKEMGEKKKVKPAPSKKVDSGLKEINFYWRNYIIIPLQLIIFSLLGFILYKTSFDPFQKNLRYIEYYSDRQEWHKVLDTAVKFSMQDASNKDYFKVTFHIDRAIAHLGQLGERIFEYPQPLGIYGLIIDANHENSAAIKCSDLYFDLGLISESQRWAFEAQTLQPKSPRVLKRLVMINLVNKNYEIADEFLSVLDKNMLCKKWVKQYRQFLTNPDLTSSNDLIVEKRNFIPADTNMFINDEEGLKVLVETNRNNFLAYQYLMSYFLLKLNLDEFIRYLEYFDEYNIEKLPRSWGEALCLYSVNNKKFPADVSKNLEPQAMDYLNSLISFSRLFSEYSNEAEVRKAAYSKFGQTFWYYTEFSNPAVLYSIEDTTEIK